MGQGNSDEWKGYQHQLLADKKLRGYLVPNSAKPNTSPILRNLRSKDGFCGFLKDDDQKQDLDTAWKLFNVSYVNHADRSYTGSRPWTDALNNPSKRGPYQWMTYKEFGDYAVDFGCGLRELNIPDQSNIGIFSINRPEWYICHMGNLSQTYRTTALYDTLGSDAVSYIIHHAEVPVILTEKSKLKTLFKAIDDVKKKCDDQKDEEFKLKYIIQIDVDNRYKNEHETVDDSDIQTASSYGVELVGLSSVLEKGKLNHDKHLNKHLPAKEDVAYIMYTSGTTGNPKGVILSHQSFAATVACTSRATTPSANDIHCSYLPLAHIFEACCMAFISAQGAKVGYYQGSIRKIGSDWKDIRPTILIGVPRVFNKTYEKFKLKVSKFPSIKQWFVSLATSSSTTQIRKGQRNAFYDKYVWDSVAKEIGFDRVRLTVSGAAPLPPHIAEFLRIILPTSAVQQGYGLTEVCAAATIADEDDLALGHVGAPTDVMEIRLIDAPECGYKTTDKPHPRGEIQLRGLNMMNGYYKNDTATAKVLDATTGWFSTGDIGRFNPNGTLSIIDRRKNLFKTSTGEYIASEKIENTYSRASLVGQIWVYGNSFKSFIVAIIVPDAQVLCEILKDKKLWNDNDCKITVATDEYANRFKQVCDQNKDLIKKIILDDMKQYQNDLKKFEWIKDIDLEFNIDNLLQGFNVDNNLLTPTFKKKRPQLLKKYVNQIKLLYTNNGEPPNDNENWVK